MIVLGALCVALGFAGIVLPVLPTTPFLLAALWFFSRSSPALRDKLLKNRILRPYVEYYGQSDGGMPKKVKIRTLAILWSVLTISIVFFAEELWLRILLFLVGVAVTIHIAMIRKPYDN